MGRAQTPLGLLTWDLSGPLYAGFSHGCGQCLYGKARVSELLLCGWGVETQVCESHDQGNTETTVGTETCDFIYLFLNYS